MDMMFEGIKGMLVQDTWGGYEAHQEENNVETAQREQPEYGCKDCPAAKYSMAKCAADSLL